MKNEEILRKAIKKAMFNGFDFWSWVTNYCPNEIEEDVPASVIHHIAEDKVYHSLIFSHIFARYFWGIEYFCEHGFLEVDTDGMGTVCLKCGKEKTYQGWENALQQMVLEKEPLKYLEKYV